MKAKTKAANLARRRRRSMVGAGLPELAPIPKQTKQLRVKGKFVKHEEDESRVALEARCRQAGVATNEAAIRDARAPWNGCNAGKAMASLVVGNAERAAMWDAIQHMRKVWMEYDRAMGAPRRHAQCLRIMLPMEAVEADAATPIRDDRTDEERYRQAKDARRDVGFWLTHVEPRAAMICLSSVIDDAICRDPDAMVRALQCVSDGIQGRKIAIRRC